ncbi:MAG: zinc ribbon domain-containing protein, partial [Acidimicrobiales bacterium]
PYNARMPFYDFRCPTCDERFEVRRPISESDQPVSCPQGHDGAVRVITTWGTGSAIRSGNTAGAGKPKNAGTVESAAAHIAKHKRRDAR